MSPPPRSSARTLAVTDTATPLSEEHFPLLLAVARSRSNVVAALRSIATGIEAHAIRKVAFDQAKRTLSSTVCDAWSRYVGERFFHDGQYRSQSEEVNKLESSLAIDGLHSVVSGHRKLINTRASGPAVDAMRALIAELLPLAQAVAVLKQQVVKGRAPNTGHSKPVNPNKVMKTCPVCFRSIAVVRGTMAHHGYERPGLGWQTASCPGIRFPPLEVSTEGLQWLIGAVSARETELTAAYSQRGSLDRLVVIRARSSVTILKTSPDWAREFELYVSGLEAEIVSLQRQLAGLQRRLREWQPELPEQPRDSVSQTSSALDTTGATDTQQQPEGQR